MILESSRETSIYPFYPGSTMLINTNQTIPIHCVLDICLYPRGVCNPPYFISNISKKDSLVLFQIADGDGDGVCTVVFSKEAVYGLPAGWTKTECIGYAIQNSCYVGCIYGGLDLAEFMTAFEGSSDLDNDALMIDPCCIHIRPNTTDKGDLVIDGYRVNSINWDTTHITKTGDTATIEHSEKIDSAPININKVTINGVSVSGKKDIYIIPDKDNGIRVKNTDRVIIGKLSDL